MLGFLGGAKWISQPSTVRPFHGATRGRVMGRGCWSWFCIPFAPIGPRSTSARVQETSPQIQESFTGHSTTNLGLNPSKQGSESFRAKGHRGENKRFGGHSVDGRNPALTEKPCFLIIPLFFFTNTRDGFIPMVPKSCRTSSIHSNLGNGLDATFVDPHL